MAIDKKLLIWSLQGVLFLGLHFYMSYPYFASQFQHHQNVNISNNNNNTSTLNLNNNQTPKDGDIHISFNSPNIWHESLWWLKAIMIIFFPTPFLITFGFIFPLLSSVGWNAFLYLFLIFGTLLFPEWTIILGAFYHQYHTRNAIELTTYFLYYWFSQLRRTRRHALQQDGSISVNGQQTQQGDSTSTTTTTGGGMAAATLQALSNQLGQNTIATMQMLVDGFNSLYRQVNSQKRLIALYDCDREMLQNFTRQQLVQLKHELSDRIDIIEEVEKSKTPARTIVLNDGAAEAAGIQQQNAQRDPRDNFEACVICMNEKPRVQLNPCQHACLCKHCVKELQDRNEIECPICRTPILSVLYVRRRILDSQTLEQFAQQAQEYTKQQLSELSAYVKQNPKSLDQVQFCKPEQF